MIPPLCHKGKEMVSPILMRKVRSKMSKWKLSLSTHQPVNPWFSNCDDQHHKPNNFEMAALESSLKAKNELLVASWKEVATPYFIFAKINLFLVR